MEFVTIGDLKQGDGVQFDREDDRVYRVVRVSEKVIPAVRTTEVYLQAEDGHTRWLDGPKGQPLALRKVE